MCFQITTIKRCSKCEVEVEWTSTVSDCIGKMVGNCRMGIMFESSRQTLALCPVHQQEAKDKAQTPSPREQDK